MNIFRRITIYTVLVCVVFPLSILNAQTIINTGALSDFATELHTEYLKNRVKVEEYAHKNNIPISQEFADGTAKWIHHIENNIPVYYLTTNLGAAQTTRTDELWPTGGSGLNLTGNGYSRLGQWDYLNVLTTHQEFGTRVTQIDDPSNTVGTSIHATHVAGTLVATGIEPGAKGMAFEANLKTYDWENDDFEMVSAALSGMEISNHSYVFATGWSVEDTGGPVWEWFWYGDISVSSTEDYKFGFYGLWTSYWDFIAYNAPNYLIVTAAGNERNTAWIGEHYVLIGGIWSLSSDTRDPDGDYDCIPSRGVAKNILTVGAVEELINYTQPSDVIMTDFSSWGPADDGRIKPDLVGKGVSLYSTNNQGDNRTYSYFSGTSMSSPNVAGTLALLQQYYQDTHSSVPMYSATLKALVIHTTDETGPADGPDYMFGWGLLNSERAAGLISFDSYGNNVIEEQVLSEGSTYARTINSDGTKPLRVTICWTDPESAPVTSNLLNNRTPLLVNNLDLKMINNSTIYHPWKLDPNNPANAATNTAPNNVDNIEQVYISSPPAGNYTIEVSHNGILSPLGNQAFSIIVSGNNVCVDGSIIYNTDSELFNFCEDGMWVEK